MPEDLEERETGSLAVPTSSSLEAMIIQEEIEEQLAAARRLGNNAKVQLPDRRMDEPAYVKSNPPTTSAKVENKTGKHNRGCQTTQPEVVKEQTLVEVAKVK